MRLSIFSLIGLIVPTFGYMVETVTTHCWLVDQSCHQGHAKDVAEHIKKTTDYVYMNIVYVSHSTTSTKYGMHSMIVYK
jgi:hypothetical protein